MGLIRFTLFIAIWLFSIPLYSQQMRSKSIPSSEHIQIVFNQDVYSTGDTAYFALHFHHDDFTPIEGSHYITVGVYNDSGAPLSLTKLQVVGGYGDGHILLSKEWPAGIYTILGYSNISGSRVFIQNVAIVSNSDLKLKRAFSFYPEGGNGAYGFINRIGVHSNKSNSEVLITNSSDSVIAKTLVDGFGWGTMDVHLLEGDGYFASNKGSDENQKLPIFSTTGFAIKIDGLDSDDKQLEIKAMSSSAVNDTRLIVTSNNRVKFESKFNYQTGEQIVRNVPKSILGKGLHQITIIDNKGQLLAYREFYLPGVGSASLNIRLNKESYHSRKPVELELSLSDAEGKTLSGKASIRIINESAFGKGAQPISNSFGLMDILRSETSTSINAFLIGQSRRLVEEDLSMGRNSSKYLKSGQAIYKTTGEPLPEGAKLLFYFHKSQQLALIQLSEGAEFGFENVNEVNGSDGIFYVAEDYFGFEIDDVYIDWSPERIVSPSTNIGSELTEGNDNYISFNRNKKLIDESFSTFSDNNKTKETKSSVDLWESKYLEADNIFDMSKYQVFPSMKETITEIIRPLDVVRKNRKSIIRINNLTPATSSSMPVYIIDGVATKDTDYLLALSPADLKEVRIYRDRVNLKKLGFLGRNGVVRVTTKAGNAAPPISQGDVITSPSTYSNETSNTAPNLSPRFESSIYWNPNVSIDASGLAKIQFATSDDIGTYRIIVSGIADDGQYFHSEKTIEVGLSESNGMR